METRKITRNGFIKNSSKFMIGGITGIAGINLMVNNQAKAGSFRAAPAPWPYPYTLLDPEKVRERAHFLYWNDMDCSSGVFGAFVQLLAEELGDPWTNIPVEILLFGRGGGAGWGSLCGTLTGAAAIISMVSSKADSTNLINEVWGWYTTENLPSETANAKNYEVQNFVGTLPSNISGSVLCHPSVSQWCVIANKKVSDVDRKERCARLAGDIAAKTCEVLNDHYHASFVSTFHDTGSVTACMSCHNPNTMTHMECVACHSQAHFQSSGLRSYDLEANGHSLDNAFPNPFSSSTTFRFSIPEREKVRLEIYDIKGRLVSSLIDSDFMERGTYDADWDGSNNAGARAESGVYLVRLTTADYMKSIRIVMER